MLKATTKKLYHRINKYKITRVAFKVFYYSTSALILTVSGIFDRRWYSIQKLHMGDVRDYLPLVLHYLIVGRKKGYTPHPLFIPEYFDLQAKHEQIDPVLKYLFQRKNWATPTHPLFDGSTYKKIAGNSNPLVHFIKNTKSHIELPAPRSIQEILTKSITYNELLKKQTSNQVIWQEKENLRHTNKPSRRYDYARQRSFIKKWSDVDLDNGKSNTPLVSVIMPSWNRETVICEAIESLQAQTLQNWELIIGDDGSTDRTLDVIKRYADKDKRIKLLSLSHGGVCKARNAALKQAVGEWITFLDSDNSWTPYFLQVTIAAMQAEDMKVAYTSVKMNESNGVRFRINEPNVELLGIGNYIDLNVLMLHKTVIDVVGCFNESLKRAVDHDLIMRIAKKYEMHYLPIIGVNYTNHDNMVRISNTELLSWGGVVKSNNIINWDQQNGNRSNDVISIVVAVRNDIDMANNCILKLIQNTDLTHAEIIIVDSSSGPAMTALVSSFCLISKKITYIYSPESQDLALGSNIGFTHTNGDNIVFIQQWCRVEPGWLEPILNELNKNKGSIVGPIQLAPNHTITSAGVLFASIGKRVLPVRFLRHHPQEDARRLDEVYSVKAITDGCIALSSSSFSVLRGFNPLYNDGFETADLCLRSRDITGDAVRMVRSSRVVNLHKERGWMNQNYSTFVSQWMSKTTSDTNYLWKKAGFNISHYVTDEVRQIDSPGKIAPVLVRLNKTLRWAIKSASPADDARFEWGDYYYATAIAQSLEKLGHEVIVDNRSSHSRPTTYLDDVTLNLRGLVQFTPQPNKINIMWVISHPELITNSEIKAYDLVYAAGEKWARDATSQSGVSVKVLLQCSDSKHFSPSSTLLKEYRGKIIAVCNSRNIFRKVVKDSIRADLDVNVYGSRWEQFIDSKYIKKQLIPNIILPKVYESAGVIMNDHWDDMREWGFISNRLFDAASVGACIVSDRIEGADKIFGKLLYQYDTYDDLKVLKSDLSSVFPNRKQRLSIAKDIRLNHSFDARSRTLSHDALNLINKK